VSGGPARRDDPLGKRALFETPPVRPDDPLDDDPLIVAEHPDGRDALFSTGPHQPGTVVVGCSHCGVRSRISLVEAAVRIFAISLWFPGKTHSRWIQCPSCQRRAWCKIEWFG